LGDAHAPLRVCLDRTVELEAARLRLRDWPGLDGPLVHVPDPFFADVFADACADVCADDSVLEELAAALAPAYRLLSLTPRNAQGYQVAAADLLGVLDQFGFVKPILIAERSGCAPALLVAAWHPGRIGKVVLIDAAYDPPDSARIEAQSLRDCPVNWSAVRNSVDCPVLDLTWHALAMARLQNFLDS
jgi:pimeloyl-ACP methyl ester carboxylesterase